MDLGSIVFHLPAGQELSFPVPQAVSIIGRAANNDIVINHPSISRRHARLLVEPGRIQIDDLGSANGTSVGGDPLQPGHPRRLRGDETIRLGEVQVHYHPPAVPLGEQISPPAPTVAAHRPDAPTAVTPAARRETGPEAEPGEKAEELEEAPRRMPIWVLPLVGVVGLCALLAMAAGAYIVFVGGKDEQPAAVGPVIQAFTARPAEIPPGDSAVLAWEVTGAQLVDIEPDLGEVAASGSQVITPTQSTVYTLIAVAPEGTATTTVEVRVTGGPPVIQSFSVDPAGVVEGQTRQVTLSWSVTEADSVDISGLEGPLEFSGSQVIPAPQTPTRFTLIAVNQFGETRQDLLLDVISSGCAVSGADNLNMRAGPGTEYPVLTVLDAGTPVEPLGRVEPADWLQVRANDRQGWASARFVICAVDIAGFPTVDPALLPPTPTPTATPSPSSTPAPSPTATVTPTPAPATATATATPRFSAGQVTFKTGAPGDVSLFALGPTGDPIPLMEHKTDLAVLDYTAASGLYLLWVQEDTVESVALLLSDGTTLRANIRPDPQWATVTDGDFSPDGTRFIVEAVAAGKPAYYYFDSSGDLLAAPALAP